MTSNYEIQNTFSLFFLIILQLGVQLIQMTMEERNVGKRSVNVREDGGPTTIDMTVEEDTKQGLKTSEEEEDAVERRDTEENKEEEECTLELGEQVDHFEVLQGIRFN